MDLSFNKYVVTYSTLLMSHRFTKWPINLNMFEQLQELILSGCHLSRFGDDMRGLANLKVLALNGNKMKVGNYFANV